MATGDDDLRFLDHFNTLKNMIKDHGRKKDIIKYMKENDITADRFKRGMTSSGRYFTCPVCAAAMSGRLATMKELIEMGFSYQSGSPDDLGLNLAPIHRAAFGGHLKIVQFLIDEHGVDVESRDCYDNSPLYWAINKSSINMDMVNYFIEKGAGINERNKVDNSTLLHVSVRRFGNKDVCEYLLAHGADVNARDHLGNTPLHDAALWGHENCTRALLDAGADVNARSRSEDTPFHMAAKTNKLALKKLLYSHGADPQSYNRAGNTALHLAVMEKSSETVYYLTVDLNVDPDVVNKVKATPFSLAVYSLDLNIAKLLYNCGCRPTIMASLTDILDFQMEKEAMISFLKDVTPNSRSLQDLCIFKVRRFFGTRLSSAIDFLPLPGVIKDLIKLSHLSES